MSEVKVNKISPRSGTDVTLGDSGDTFTIPSGATINNQGTAVNFGATGSASWVTTPKTGDFTAVAGEGYFINTTGGEIDVTLPAGTAGAVVAVADYANNFATANCILKQNGSDKIEGSTNDLVINQKGVSITLVFVDSTKGWVTTDTGNSSNAFVNTYVEATGGTITCSGDYRIHTFTGPGTFCVTSGGTPAGSTLVDYLIVAGGGGGGNYTGGGGGGGGFRESPGTASGSYTVSPRGAAPAVSLPVSAIGYPIVVGSGGAGSTTPGDPGGPGTRGSTSTALGITSTGGGAGGGSNLDSPNGPGGSGGGGSEGRSGATGNTPPVSPAQGTDGGNGSGPGPENDFYEEAGGGGGATAVGCNGTHNVPSGGSNANGGAGATTSISASPTAYAGGGGGGKGSSVGSTIPQGGTGGGGNGSFQTTNATAGTTNTGGGGGGVGAGPGPSQFPGASGGSGIVVIRYKFQN